MELFPQTCGSDEGMSESYQTLLTWAKWSNQQPVPQTAQEGLHHEGKRTYTTQEEKGCPNSGSFIASTVVTTLIVSVLLLLRRQETCFTSLTPDASAGQKGEDLHWGALPGSVCGQTLYPRRTGEAGRQPGMPVCSSSAGAGGGRALLQ